MTSSRESCGYARNFVPPHKIISQRLAPLPMGALSPFGATCLRPLTLLVARYVLTHDFVPSGEGQIVASAGETVTLVARYEGGWATVIKDNGDKVRSHGCDTTSEPLAGFRRDELPYRGGQEAPASSREPRRPLPAGGPRCTTGDQCAGQPSVESDGEQRTRQWLRQPLLPLRHLCTNRRSLDPLLGARLRGHLRRVCWLPMLKQCKSVP